VEICLYHIITKGELDKNTNLEQRIEMFRKMLLSSIGEFYIAFSKDLPCGLCSFSESRDENMKGFAEVVSIYILEQYRGNGVCTKIMDFVLSEIKQQWYMEKFI